MRPFVNLLFAIEGIVSLFWWPAIFAYALFLGAVARDSLVGESNSARKRRFLPIWFPYMAWCFVLYVLFAAFVVGYGVGPVFYLSVAGAVVGAFVHIRKDWVRRSYQVLMVVAIAIVGARLLLESAFWPLRIPEVVAMSLLFGLIFVATYRSSLRFLSGKATRFALPLTVVVLFAIEPYFHPWSSTVRLIGFGNRHPTHDAVLLLSVGIGWSIMSREILTGFPWAAVSISNWLFGGGYFVLYYLILEATKYMPGQPQWIDYPAIAVLLSVITVPFGFRIHQTWVQICSSHAAVAPPPAAAP